MKTPAELAARLRKMVLAAQHHYSPTGEPMRSIVVSPEWLEDMADAANALEHQSLIVSEWGTTRGPAAYVTDDYGHEGVSHSISASLPVGTPLYTKPVGINKF